MMEIVGYSLLAAALIFAGYKIYKNWKSGNTFGSNGGGSGRNTRIK